MVCWPTVTVLIHLSTPLQHIIDMCKLAVSVNSLKRSGIIWLYFEAFRSNLHFYLTYILNLWHSGTLVLRAECQSARMSDINKELSYGRDRASSAISRKRG